MAECFAIQQGVMNISICDGKNIPVRDFIQYVLNRESSVPEDCERQYIMAVLARLKGAARDTTHGKTFSTITNLIQHLKQRFAPHKTYSWYLHEISTIRMSCSESVSKFYDRITILESEAQVALEDKYQNAEQMLLPLNDCALEAFIRGLPDVISGMVESRNLSSLEAALKYTLEYEARRQLNPHFPINNIIENRYSTPYAGCRDRSPSPDVRFASSLDRNRTVKHPLP